MDPFKRATLLTTQAAMGQITSDEVRIAATELIPLMQADPESQPAEAAAKEDETPPSSPRSHY